MANTFFQFKQFTVHQDKCAMKVCTDACLFGAWVAEKVCDENWKLDNILDIGAGTGLLSLMLAQKLTNAAIDAIEINPDAAKQAANNFQSSLWSNRFNIIEADIKSIEATKKYDLIISNPPFFDNDLKSPHADRNLALHSSELSIEQLVRIAKNLSAKDGKFAVLLPFHRAEETEELARSCGFFSEEKILVRQTDKHPFFRVMFIFGKTGAPLKTSEIVIKQNNVYSPQFIELLRDYYLYL